MLSLVTQLLEGTFSDADARSPIPPGGDSFYFIVFVVSFKAVEFVTLLKVTDVLG